jgi:hypothetical protein
MLLVFALQLCWEALSISSTRRGSSKVRFLLSRPFPRYCRFLPVTPTHSKSALPHPAGGESLRCLSSSYIRPRICDSQCDSHCGSERPHWRRFSPRFAFETDSRRRNERTQYQWRRRSRAWQQRNLGKRVWLKKRKRDENCSMRRQYNNGTA